MLFGFVVAIIVGFLLTAVQNWTGQESIASWPLAAVFGLWLLARILLLYPIAAIEALLPLRGIRRILIQQDRSNLAPKATYAARMIAIGHLIEIALLLPADKRLPKRGQTIIE